MLKEELGLILGCSFLVLELLIKPRGSIEVLIGSCLDNAGCILVHVWRMQAVLTLVWRMQAIYIGSCLESAGCILAPVWRMQAIYWLLSGECGLYIGCCLKNAYKLDIGSHLEDAGYITFLSGGHMLYFGSCL